MLILTRKLGESINIGENIKVSVLGIHGRQVRIGIDAPMNVVVHREEIYMRIQQENKKASSISGDLKGMVELLKGKIKKKNINDSNGQTMKFKNKGKSDNNPGQSKEI